MTDVVQEGADDEPEVGGVAQEISPEVHLALAQAALGNMTSTIEGALRQNRDQVLHVVTRILEKADIAVRVSRQEGGEHEQVAIQVDVDRGRTLTSEQENAVLLKLVRRFMQNQDRHARVEWRHVEPSLRANSEALWSLHQMEEAGHEPDLYMEDEKAFYFGTCSAETPAVHRNIVLDSEAWVYLTRYYPGRTCEGNAADIAAAMGIELMNEIQYRNLQTLGRFDSITWSWLATPDSIRREGKALYGHRDDIFICVSEHDAHGAIGHRSFRGSLRVPKG